MAKNLNNLRNIGINVGHDTDIPCEIEISTHQFLEPKM